MSSPTERAAAGGRAAARPESPADQPPTASPAARPEPAANGSSQGPAGPGAGDPGPLEVPLFLRAGRAGLAPEAVTVVGQPDEDALACPPLSARPDVAGRPPWADELAGPEPDTLPPWEAGPWPSYEPPARDPGGPGDHDDHGQPGASAPPARRPADPFAGHFADVSPATDHGPATSPLASQPDASAGPAGTGQLASSAPGRSWETGAAPGPGWPPATVPDAESPASRLPADDTAAGAAAGSGPGSNATLDPAPAAGPPLDRSLAARTAADPSLAARTAADPSLAARTAADRSLTAGRAIDPALAGTARNGFTLADTALDPFPAVGAARSPGGPATGPARAAGGAAGFAAPGSAAPGSAAPGSAAAGPAATGPGAANPLGTAALAGGILGIAVLPGVVLGILGLRRAAITGTGRLQSWLGIALSLLWAAGIIILALPGPGPASDPGCVQYRASGAAAVARVTSALQPKAPSARLRAGLGPAGNAVNDATASAQNIDVRNTLAVLSSDLQAEQAAVLAGRPAPAALGVTLAADAAAAAHLCGAPS